MRFIEKIMRYILIDLLKISVLEKNWTSFIEFVKFGIVGVSNSVVSYVVYTLTLVLLRQFELFSNTDYYFAQFVSFILSVLWSFYWNNKLVFVLKEGENRSWLKSLIKTYISYSFTGLFLNSFLLMLWIDVCGISEFLAPIINLIIGVPINFVINKLWAFRKENS